MGLIVRTRFRYRFGIVAIIALVAGLLTPQTCDAATPLLSAAGGSGPNTITFALGWEINVGAQPLRLTALGVWDSGDDGLIASHAVGVWNATGTLLGQTTVPAGTGGTLNASYRYADLLTPVDLAANTTYVIGAAYNSDDSYRFFGGFGDSANSHVNGGITVGFGRNDPGAALIFPTGTTSAVYTGPNALFVAIPEPASGATGLIVAGITACASRRRRR